MGLDASKVYIPIPEQTKTTGAMVVGDIITDAPTTFEEALAAIKGFDDCGYCSEDGLTLSPSIDVNEAKEWAGNTVKKKVDSFDGSLELSVIQLDGTGWETAIGAENVQVVPATAEHGEQIRVGLGAHLPPARCHAWRLKDDDARIVIIAPNSQVTELGDMTFNRTDPVPLDMTISAYDDGTGNAIYIFFDDGTKASIAAADKTKDTQSE